MVSLGLLVFAAVSILSSSRAQNDFDFFILVRYVDLPILVLMVVVVVMVGFIDVHGKTPISSPSSTSSGLGKFLLDRPTTLF